MCGPCPAAVFVYTGPPHGALPHDKSLATVIVSPEFPPHDGNSPEELTNDIAPTLGRVIFLLCCLPYLPHSVHGLVPFVVQVIIYKNFLILYS